jgi:hypothetical protein
MSQLGRARKGRPGLPEHRGWRAFRDAAQGAFPHRRSGDHVQRHPRAGRLQGQLYTAPTGATGGNINVSGVTYVYATDDPEFGKLPDVASVYDLAPMGRHLYAGTGGLGGFQIWRTTAEGSSLPYQWEKVMDGGAGRGALNQGGRRDAGFPRLALHRHGHSKRRLRLEKQHRPGGGGNRPARHRR